MFSYAGCFSTKGSQESLLNTVLTVPLSNPERLFATAVLVSTHIHTPPSAAMIPVSYPHKLNMKFRQSESAWHKAEAAIYSAEAQ